ncbi:hypothetical protein H6F51_18040 [Cyanobacteria bacterium FACHB-DQ100]|nr:hypothetical protein [Cyanobacteria bacterium FACHB-DQ100]
MEIWAIVQEKNQDAPSSAVVEILWLEKAAHLERWPSGLRRSTGNGLKELTLQGFQERFSHNLDIRGIQE